MTVVFGLTKTIQADSNPAIADDSTPRILNIHKEIGDDSGIAGIGQASDDPKNDPLKGIKFDIEKVTFDNNTAPNPSNNSTYTVDSTFGTKTITTDDTGLATINLGVTNGTYLVTEEDNADVTIKVAPFFIQLPMTKRDGNQDSLQYTVDVYPKNQVASGPGTITAVNAAGSNSDEVSQENAGVSGVIAKNDQSSFFDTVQSGKPLVWNVISDIPGARAIADNQALDTGGNGDISQASEYDLYLEVTSKGITKFGDAEAEQGNFEKLLNTTFALGYLDTNNQLQKVADLSLTSSDYTVTQVTNPDNLPDDIGYTDHSDNIKIALTATGRQKVLQAVKASQSKANGNVLSLISNVKVQNQTNLTSGVYDADSYLDYTNSLGTNTTSTQSLNGQDYDTDAVAAKNDLVLHEASADSNQNLSGAIFAVAPTAALAKAGQYIKIGTDGTLYYPGDPDYGQTGQTDYTVTTDSNGDAYFDGLRSTDNQDLAFMNTSTFDDINDAAKRTYYAVEIKAPTGYELNKTAIPVDSTLMSGTTNKVKDDPQTSFPLTGGHLLLLIVLTLIISGIGFNVYQRSRSAKIEK